MACFQLSSDTWWTAGSANVIRYSEFHMFAAATLNARLAISAGLHVRGTNRLGALMGRSEHVLLGSTPCPCPRSTVEQAPIPARK